MLKLAVVGKDVSASESPQIHTFILERMGERCSYDRVSVPVDFSARAQSLFEEYDAFNVTIPYKGEIIPFLNTVEGDARRFGAVNTVISGTRTGYNTDGYGFLLMLSRAVETAGKRFLVLGAGGAGRSCIGTLLSAGAEVDVYERDAKRLYAVHEELKRFRPLERVPLCRYDVILNCTGVGMHDTVGKLPFVLSDDGETDAAEGLLKECGAAVDLIYVPETSEFLRTAQRYGKRTVNGAAMLFYQAYRADCLFLGRAPDAAEAESYFEEYQNKKRSE